MHVSKPQVIALGDDQVVCVFQAGCFLWVWTKESDRMVGDRQTRSLGMPPRGNLPRRKLPTYWKRSPELWLQAVWSFSTAPGVCWFEASTFGSISDDFLLAMMCLGGIQQALSLRCVSFQLHPQACGCSWCGSQPGRASFVEKGPASLPAIVRLEGAGFCWMAKQGRLGRVSV